MRLIHWDGQVIVPKCHVPLFKLHFIISGKSFSADMSVVGRGVLLDYWRYVNQSYDPNTRHPISAADLKACAKHQGVEHRYGDILLIRTGWIETYEKMTQAERVKLTQVRGFDHTFVGVDQTEEAADFLHDNYFSVVASDAPAFEAWPQRPEWNHHVNLLPLWGLPIGELWDLEALSDACHKRRQYEFFFASMPMNVEGGFKHLKTAPRYTD